MDSSFLALSALYNEKLDFSFPVLRNTHQVPKHNAIAAAIGIVMTQQHDHHEELRVVREQKETTSVEAMFGEDQLQGLLYLAHIQSEADLCSRCPV